MNILTGYSIIEQLYSGDKIVVSRALRKSDNQPVVLKMLKDDYPDPHDIARLNYEYDLLKQLAIPEIVRVYAFETQQNRFALVLENVPKSMTLRTYLHTHQLDIVAFLRLSIQIADALDKIHEAGIIHKDINPDNILVIGEGEAVKILDLSVATQLAEEEHEITNSESLEGTFPYISPEQTTRMNRSIDRRTDLYSLGITFYEMLLGHLPFDARDAIEWVHCHIAKQPMAPHKLLSSIPEMVSVIILKLLSKTPEDRYATAFGLKADLEICLIAWQKNHNITKFELGTKDRKGIFKIPHKLYGRETEIQTLLSAFDNVSKGQRELLLISGYTGVGKSSLINEVQKPIVKQHGYFASGKYESYNREIPYAGLIQAFRNLINQILATNKQRIEAWRKDILEVISSNAQVIINVIPELEKLLGKQPPVIELPPVESRTRFEMVFFDFVNVFAKKEHPLVLFIDDLQWADMGSFNLITQLMKNIELKYFLLLGSYRNNEVTATHPLSAMLESFNKDHVSYKEIQLKPLSIENLKQLIADTLHTTKEIQGLADLIMEKTAGNPYFVNLFLTTLYKTQQLSFDSTRDWLFDIDAIKKSPITDNVVDLVISEIGKLSAETQELLRFAACIGSDFDLESLIDLTGKRSEEITSLLWPALSEKWIMQLGESYKYITKDVYGKQIEIAYRFSHDNVKHTLYSLTDSAIRKEIHYKLGTSLFKKYNESHPEKVFIITQHFSACLDLIQDSGEKITIAKLFYQAAEQMKQSVSYDMAIKHYEHALELLGPDIWEQQYALATDIYSNLAIVQYLAGSLEKAEPLFEKVIQKAKTPMDKARVMNSRALAYTSQAQYDASIKACEEGLRVLGLKIPKNPSKFLLLITWLKIKWHLRNKKVNSLLDLPIMQDPNKIMIMEFLEKLASVAFVGVGSFNQPAYAIMLSVLYSIKYGNHSNSSICYTLFGQFEIMRDHIERACEFGELGIKLCDRFQNINLPIVYLLAFTRIFPWKLSYKEILHYANKAFELSYDTGQMYCRQYTAATIAAGMNLANLPVTEIDKKITLFLADRQVICNHDVNLFLNTLRLMLQALQGKQSVADYYEYLNDRISGQTYIRSLTLKVGSRLQELVLAYYFEDWSRGMQLVDETDESFFRKPLNTSPAAPVFYFYCALILLNVYYQVPYFKRRSYRRQIKKLLAQLKFWQTHCPVNYTTFYYLVKAGVAAVLDDNMSQALKDYEASLASSRQSDRVLLQGIAHEFMGRCYLKRQQPRNARCYLQDAYAAYMQGGFGGKLNLLKTNFPELLNSVTVATKTHTSSSHHTTSVLDIDTVLKSAQTISSQMKLEKLLETLISIVMENAGAQRSVLLLVENDKLIVEAEGKTDIKPLILQKEPIELRDDLALSIIQYVQNTQEPVILGNATEEGEYTEDPYIIQNKPLSILCAPILYKNYLFGVLYLENNLVCEAFTQKHLELLKVLSSQIAISLENARLYSAYDQFIPHEFLDILGKHSIIDITLGDNVQKEMSVLFTDIRGFSKLSEQLGPQEIFRFMNNYLGHMAPIIKNHGGFIDKYIGDAIMALFSGEVDSAIAAGIDMQKELYNFNQELIAQGKQPIAIGIGINSGHLTLGTLGSLNRIETSVLSDAVNLSERIQELTKTYDCRLLISGTAHQKLTNRERFDIRFIERTTVRGRDEIIDVWEVYSGDPDELRYAKLAIAKHYNEAVDCFLNQSYQKALTLFQRCLASLPKDKVILKYITNCQKLISSPQSSKESGGETEQI